MWNLLPLLLTAGGTAYQAKQTNDAEARRQRQAEQGRQLLAVKQREADQRANAEINRVKQSTPEAEREAANQQFLEQLRRSRASATDTGGVGGERYKADMAGVAGDVDQFGRSQADTMARIAAPGRQRQAENVGYNRAAQDIDTISRFAEGDDFVNQLRMANIRPDGTKMAVGSFVAGLGQGMAASGGTPEWDKPGTPAYRRTHYNPNQKTSRDALIQRAMSY